MQNINQTTKEGLDSEPEKKEHRENLEQEKPLEQKEEVSFQQEQQPEEKFSFKQQQKQTDGQDETEQIKKAEELRIHNEESKKIEQLLEITKEKGADFALKVAEKAQDPLLLDLFHDTLIAKGIKKAK